MTETETDVAKLLATTSGKKVRAWATNDFGRLQVPGSHSVIVPQQKARKLVDTLRNALPLGFVAFLGTTSWLGDERHDDEAEVVVAAGADQFDILRVAKTDAANHELQTEDLIAQLQKWDAAHGIDIFHAESDTIELTLQRPPKDLLKFAEEVLEFCPDTEGDAKDVAEAIEASGEVYLRWD